MKRSVIIIILLYRVIELGFGMGKFRVYNDEEQEVLAWGLRLKLFLVEIFIGVY